MGSHKWCRLSEKYNQLTLPTKRQRTLWSFFISQAFRQNAWNPRFLLLAALDLLDPKKQQWPVTELYPPVCCPKYIGVSQTWSLRLLRYKTRPTYSLPENMSSFQVVSNVAFSTMAPAPNKRSSVACEHDWLTVDLQMNITRPVANGLNKRRLTQFCECQLSVPPGDSSKHPSQLPDKWVLLQIHHSIIHSVIHSFINFFFEGIWTLLWKLAQHSNIQFGWRASPQLAKTLGFSCPACRVRSDRWPRLQRMDASETALVTAFPMTGADSTWPDTYGKVTLCVDFL